jgi:single-strand DNA-binding protein
MLNQCQFIGNLGGDPEIRTFTNGAKVCNLRLAVSQRWKDRETGERKEKTEWVSIAIFSEPLVRLAEQYLRKGSRIFVSGQLETRKWQDQSGQDRYSTEVVLRPFKSELTMLDGKGDRQDSGDSYQRPGSAPAGGASGGGAPAMDDEIPFACVGWV